MLAFSPGDVDAWQGILARVEAAAGGSVLAVTPEGKAFLAAGSTSDSVQEAVRLWILANPVQEDRSGTLEDGSLILASPWKFGILLALPASGKELTPVWSRLRGAAKQLNWLFGDMEARPRIG